MIKNKKTLILIGITLILTLFLVVTPSIIRLVKIDDISKITIPEGKVCVLVEGVAEKIGSKYVCDTGDGNKIFYVLDKKSDTSNILLIMDRNYDDDTLSWCDQRGPNPDNGSLCNADGLQDKLKEIKHNWNNSLILDVLLPTYDQIYNVNMGADLTLTPWLYENLDGDRSTSLAEGYWTSSARSATIYGVCYGYFDGRLGFSISVRDDGRNGIRPVIVVKKSNMS